MLKIIVSGDEVFNEETQEFSTVDDFVLELEHSLVSLSKWESKFEIPFLGPQQKTNIHIYEYVKMMALDDTLTDEMFMRLSDRNITDINDYINSAQTATTFGDLPRSPGPQEIVTAELIYFWMINFSIPFECQNWHLNKLFALIRVCGVKANKPKKMSKQAMSQKYRELNERRRTEMGTRG
jgi:hypothetical protein